MNKNLRLNWLYGCIILLTIACMTAGCISEKNKEQSYKAEIPPEITDLIIIDKFTFNPDMMVITPGTTVTWINQDDVTHTIESDPGSDMKFSSKELKKGDLYTVNFDKRGTNNYHCKEHPSMTGSIIVQT